MATTQAKPNRDVLLQKRMKAMSDPKRREILRVLVERPASPSELAKELNEELSNVSYHVRQLVEYDCIELVSEEPVRGAVKHTYRATDRSLVTSEEWDAMHPVERHLFLAEIFQKLHDDFVASEAAQLLPEDDPFHLTRTPLLLDREGMHEVQEVLDRALEEAMESTRRSAERVDAGADPRMPVSLGTMLLRVPRRH
jgi:DNA-binding transcriptional ArsR family regulator